MPMLHSSASTYATGNLSDSETSNRPPAIYQHGSQRDGPIYTAHRSGNQTVDARHAEPNRQHRAKKSRMGDTWPTPQRTRYGLQRGVRRRDRGRIERWSGGRANSRGRTQAHGQENED